jgi:hypothetical protein
VAFKFLNVLVLNIAEKLLAETTDGRPFKPKKLSVPFLYPRVLMDRSQKFVVCF